MTNKKIILEENQKREIIKLLRYLSETLNTHRNEIQKSYGVHY